MSAYYEEYSVGDITVCLLGTEMQFCTYIMDENGEEYCIKEHTTYSSAYCSYIENIRFLEKADRRRFVMLYRNTMQS